MCACIVRAPCDYGCVLLPYPGIVSCGRSNRLRHEPGRVRERTQLGGAAGACGVDLGVAKTAAATERSTEEAFRERRYFFVVLFTQLITGGGPPAPAVFGLRASRGAARALAALANARGSDSVSTQVSMRACTAPLLLL